MGVQVYTPGQKPIQWAVEPDRTQAPDLWKGLEFAFPFWEKAGPARALNGIDVTEALPVGWSWSVGERGRCLHTTGGGASLVVPGTSSRVPEDEPFSAVVVIGNPIGTASSQILLGNTLGWGLKYEQFNNTGKLGFTKFGDVDLTSTLDSPPGFSVIGVSVEADGNPIIYANGVGESLNNTTAISGGGDLGIGARPDDVDPFAGDIFAVYLWRQRVLTPSEHAYLAARAFAAFRPKRRTLAFVPAEVGGDVSGTGAAELPSFEASGTGAVEVAGTGTVELPSFEASGSGEVEVAGTGAVELPAFEASGAGTVDVAGTGDVELPSFAASGQGAVTVEGSGAVQLPAFEAEGTGTGQDVTTGTGEVELPAFEASGSGAVEVQGTAEVEMPAFEASGTGTVDIEATGVAELPAFEVTATGTVDITGTGAVVMPSFVASGFQTVPPALDSDFPAVRIVRADSPQAAITRENFPNARITRIDVPEATI